MKFKTLLIALTFATTAAANGTDHYAALMAQANTAYKSGHYDSAKTIYAEIVNHGLQSPALYYNFANTLYKTGNLPAAILYYERALRLAPADADTRHNLDVSNAMIPDKINTIEPVFIDAWWGALAAAFSADGWAWLFLLLWCATCAAFIVFFISRKSFQRQAAFITGVVFAVICAVVLGLGFAAKSAYETHEAIVFSPSVNVKSEPSHNATVQFVVHEGLKVTVMNSDGDWTLIALADGNSGWVPTQSLEKI